MLTFMAISINHSGASYNLVSGSNFSEITSPFAKDQKIKKNQPNFQFTKQLTIYFERNTIDENPIYTLFEFLLTCQHKYTFGLCMQIKI